jgi:ribonuclease BN (tRNA processing enzyme)
MNVRILPTSPGDVTGLQLLTTYVVDGEIAIDAGCLGLHPTSRDASHIRHVFLTHAHIDHVGTLPIFLENGPASDGPPVRVYGPTAALETLREHIFNDRVWVTFEALRRENPAWLELTPIRPEQSVVLDGLRITPVPVAHTVPTFGYIMDDGSSVVVFGADSGPTDRIWELAAATGRLRAVFLECSFPDALEDLATRTCHLTPRLWAREAAKLPAETSVFAVHMKPCYRERIISELAGLADGRARIGEVGRNYTL